MSENLASQWNADDYSKNSSAQQKWALELIEKLKLKGDESVLDIGCGDGKITKEIARLVPDGQVFGFDFSDEMIALAKKNHKVANLDFARMDAVNFHLDRKYDVAFSNAVLHWVKDIPGVLHHLKSHLSPQGRFLFQMGGAGNARGVLAAVNEVIESAPWRRYFKDFQFPYNFCGVDEYEEWLKAAGFIAKRIEMIPKDMVHNDRKGLKGWFRTTWFPYTDRIPEEKRDNFINQCLDRYLACFPEDEEGRTHVQMVRLEVEAEAA